MGRAWIEPATRPPDNASNHRCEEPYTPRVRTPLCDLVGIEAPIVLAPMGGAVTPELAAAVSNAGALGMLPLSWTPADEVIPIIEETQRRTRLPFGVNLGLEWDQNARLASALSAGVRVLSFFWGDASGVIGQARDAGAIVFVTVGTAEESRFAAAAGADVIVAQGWEAGGHVWGTVSTLALVPRVVDAVAPIPVLAAGGIADGRGLAAVLALGAAGAWVGTRFLATTEAGIHPDYRSRVLAAGEADTFYGTLFDRGWPDAPHRVLRNSTVEAWEQAGQPASGSRPGEEDEPASRADGSPINRYSASTPTAAMGGDVEPLPHWAGQGVGLVTREESAADVVTSLVAEGEKVIRSLG
jgi:NAD(P)H-dependent flavin oxidoreductase YrpB (nitropropane dioxygenase family)